MPSRFGKSSIFSLSLGKRFPLQFSPSGLNRNPSSKIDIIRCHITQSFVIAPIVVVINKFGEISLCLLKTLNE
jgi:hypothetical protein